MAYWHRLLILCGISTSFTLFSPALSASDFNCTYAGGTHDWTDPSAWISCGGGYPDNSTSTYSAQLSSGTANLIQAIEIDAYSQTSYSSSTSAGLDGTEDLTANGMFTWTTGGSSSYRSNILTSGTVTANGGMTISGAGKKTLGSSTTLINASGQTASFSTGTIQADGSFINQAGAVFEKTTTNTAYIQGSGLFDNAGTLSVKDGTLYLYSQFSNTGLVDVQSGGLVLYGTGSHTGDFNALGSGGLYFRGNQTLLSGADVAGKVYAQSGTTTFTTGSTLAGTLTVNGSNAVVDVQSGAAVNPDTLDLAKGTFQTAGDVHVGQAFNWSNSYSKYSNNKSILGGAGRLLADGGMALTGNYTKQLGLDSSDTTTLVNVAGQTATLTEGSLYFAGAGTTFENQAGAVFEKTTTNTAYIQGSGLFDNAGTLSVKDGTLYLYSQFSNTGLVDVQSGSLRLSGEFTQRGTVDIAKSASLYRSGDYFYFVTFKVLNNKKIWYD